ncbi:MAG: citramalate synthase, partial [Oscillospiraceae bacterium]|nr:citramalate synthase [Oscillospiraceae bacterium]
EASVLVRAAKFLKKYNPMFDLLYSKILSEQPTNNEYPSSAITKVRVGDTYGITASEGDGPVHALDKALRKALDVFYPTLRDVHLIDYKVRVMDSASATAALVRVFIESTDGKDVWTTVGVSTDIIEASLIALVDSIEYKLMRDNKIL